MLQDVEHKFSDVLNLATEKRHGYPDKQKRVIKHLTEIAVKCELSLPSRIVKDDSDDDTDDDPDDNPLAHAIRAESLEVVQRLLELGIVPNDHHVQLTRTKIKQAIRIRGLINDTRAGNKKGLRFGLHETVLRDLRK